MYYADELVEEVRMKNDIVDVISGYVKLKRKGSSYFGLCPFHNEKSPSFSVSPGKQMYYCFGCGAGGNVYTFIMEYENYSFVEALQMLAERAGVELPKMEYSKEARAAADLRSKILEINKVAAQYYYYHLRTDAGKQAYEYLKGRELSDETIKKFGLGYSNKYSDDLYKYLKQKKYSDELLRQSGLMNVDERRGMYDKFWNRVIFPIMDVNNKVIGFGGRVMGDGTPKYLNSPETKVFDKSRNLYGLNIARTTRRKFLLICEGYMDVISMHQAGFTNAVASLGTALTSQQASLLKRYTQEVILMYDSDGAGVKAALRAIPILKAAGLSVKVIDLRPHKDPDDFIKALGAEAFEERLAKAQNSFLYEIDMMKADYNMEDPESKTAFHNEIARRLLQFPEELERNNYLEAVASKYHIGFDHLRKLVGNLAMKGTALPKQPERRINREVSREKDDGMKKSQRLLLTWLIEQVEIFEIIKPYIAPEDFTTDLYRNVAQMLFDQYQAGSLRPADIINRFIDQDEQREVAALFNASIPIETKQEQEKALKETIYRVKKNSIDDQTAHMEITDITQIQQMVQNRRCLEDIEKLHISLN